MPYFDSTAFEWLLPFVSRPAFALFVVCICVFHTIAADEWLHFNVVAADPGIWNIFDRVTRQRDVISWLC